MKRFIIGVLTTLSVGCAGCSSTEVQSRVKYVHEVVHTAPPNGHLAWCRGNDPAGCFELAGTYCSNEVLEGSFATQHPKPGPWHQVAETDMAFPAMIQENDGWRMWFACGDK